MLRTRLVRSQARAFAPVFSPVRSQLLRRSFADNKTADNTTLPGSLTTEDATKVPPPPTIAPTTAQVQPLPRVPPTPEAVGAVPPTPSTNTSHLPPLGTGSAAVAPGQGSPKPKPKRRFRRFLYSLLLLSALGYAGGVYYSLVSDNFHDFFTQYIPFGEDSVAYFEEREFRKRFPTRFQTHKYPQIRGENKVTIARTSGVTSRPASETSAVEDNSPKHAQQAPSDATSKEKTAAVQSAKKDSTPATTAEPKKEPSSSSSAPLINNLTLPNASEPVVQDVVQMLNDIITVINNDPTSAKYESTIAQAKSQVAKIVSDIATLKAQMEKEAQDKITAAHTEFDAAANELVRRLQSEMQDQETHWRDEYESEREKLSQGYQNKLEAELSIVRQVAEQRVQNALVEQEIALHRQFAQSVKDRVEQERAGRLSKLDQLSSSVEELEKLTGDWNKVVDANLATQHMHIALDAVRNAVNRFDHPTPFINELAALKEISSGNDVVTAAIASIPPTAYQRGIPTPAHLIERFRRVASEVRKASLLPEDAGIASHAASAVLSKFMFQKQGAGVPDGDDVEAVLTRTQVSLEEGDLDAAAREMNSLAGWAGVLSRDWVAECRRVLEVRQALDVIATEARLQSLLAD